MFPPGASWASDRRTHTRGRFRHAVDCLTVLTLLGFAFPRDHYPHEDASKEWWYFSGLLRDESGKSYSYCYIVFRFLRSQVWVFSMTNLDTGKPVFQKIEAYPKPERWPGRDTLDLNAGNRYLSLTSENSFVFRITEPHLSFDLEVQGLKPPATHGGSGHVLMGEGDTSSYYSISRMSAKGVLTAGDVELRLQGDAWMDHQWGSWDRGWEYDWFSFRFEDSTELMLGRFHDEEGRPLELCLVGTYIDKNGNCTPVKEFLAEPLGHYWMDGDSMGKYPLRWHISVPSLGIDLVTEAIAEDQYFWLDDKHLIWEGACRIASGNRRGYCFLEMVGY